MAEVHENHLLVAHDEDTVIETLTQLRTLITDAKEKDQLVNAHWLESTHASESIAARLEDQFTLPENRQSFIRGEFVAYLKSNSQLDCERDVPLMFTAPKLTRKALKETLYSELGTTPTYLLGHVAYRALSLRSGDYAAHAWSGFGAACATYESILNFYGKQYGLVAAIAARAQHIWIQAIGPPTDFQLDEPGLRSVLRIANTLRHPSLNDDKIQELQYSLNDAENGTIDRMGYVEQLQAQLSEAVTTRTNALVKKAQRIVSDMTDNSVDISEDDLRASHKEIAARLTKRAAACHLTVDERGYFADHWLPALVFSSSVLTQWSVLEKSGPGAGLGIEKQSLFCTLDEAYASFISQFRAFLKARKLDAPNLKRADMLIFLRGYGHNRDERTRLHNGVEGRWYAPYFAFPRLSAYSWDVLYPIASSSAVVEPTTHMFLAAMSDVDGWDEEATELAAKFRARGTSLDTEYYSTVTSLALDIQARIMIGDVPQSTRMVQFLYTTIRQCDVHHSQTIRYDAPHSLKWFDMAIENVASVTRFFYLFMNGYSSSNAETRIRDLFGRLLGIFRDFKRVTVGDSRVAYDLWLEKTMYWMLATGFSEVDAIQLEVLWLPYQVAKASFEGVRQRFFEVVYTSDRLRLLVFDMKKAQDSVPHDKIKPLALDAWNKFIEDWEHDETVDRAAEKGIEMVRRNPTFPLQVQTKLRPSSQAAPVPPPLPASTGIGIVQPVLVPSKAGTKRPREQKIAGTTHTEQQIEESIRSVTAFINDSLETYAHNTVWTGPPFGQLTVATYRAALKAQAARSPAFRAYDAVIVQANESINRAGRSHDELKQRIFALYRVYDLILGHYDAVNQRKFAAHIRKDAQMPLCFRSNDPAQKEKLEALQKKILPETSVINYYDAVNKTQVN